MQNIKQMVWIFLINVDKSRLMHMTEIYTNVLICNFW